MVNELKRVLLDFLKNGSFLLINKILLFQYSEGIYSVSTGALALKFAQNDYVLQLFITRIKLAVESEGTLGNERVNIETIENVNELKRVLLDFLKNGSFLLINKILLFQYSEGIYSVSTRAVALKFAQNDHVLQLFITRIKLAVKP